MSGFITLHKPTYGDEVLVPIERIVTVTESGHGMSYVALDGRSIGLEVRESLAEIRRLIDAAEPPHAGRQETE
jgi:hypothetical protein